MFPKEAPTCEPTSRLQAAPEATPARMPLPHQQEAQGGRLAARVSGTRDLGTVTSPGGGAEAAGREDEDKNEAPAVPKRGRGAF